MGLFSWLRDVLGAERTRRAMRKSYSKHVKAAKAGKLDLPEGISPHEAGLFGALSTRYMMGGINLSGRSEAILWRELLPFLHLPEGVSVRALAEYVVWLEPETQSKADRNFLAFCMALGVDRAIEAGTIDAAEISRTADLPWGILLPRGVEVASRTDLLMK